MVLVAVNRLLRQRGVAGPARPHAADRPRRAGDGLRRRPARRPQPRLRAPRARGRAHRPQSRASPRWRWPARLNGPLIPYHLGFIIGPRINAGGRIGDAALGARLLSLDDDHSALVIASRLDELNSERKSIEAEAVEEAYRAAEAEIGGGEGPPVLILASGTWHPGIVGIVASRVRERFERPTFAIALAPDGTGTGSGRSMPGVDLGGAVIAAVEAGLIAKGGGHAMAAGATIKPGQLGPFRAFLYEKLAGQVAVAREATALHIDAAISARGATPELFHDIERAGPLRLRQSDADLRPSGAPGEVRRSRRAGRPRPADPRLRRWRAAPRHRLPLAEHAARGRAPSSRRYADPRRRHAQPRPLSGPRAGRAPDLRRRDAPGVMTSQP